MHLSDPETEVKFKVKKRPKNLVRRIIIFAVVLYLGLLVYRTVHDIVIIRLADAMRIPYGLVYSVMPVSGTVVREEKVYFAPKSGTLKVVVPEGERVRVGETAAQIAVPSFDSKSGETYFDIKAAQAGIVSYFLDGLEEVYSLANLNELDLDRISKPQTAPEKLQAGAKVTQGKPVFKIVNNLKPLYVVGTLAPQSNLIDLAEGSVLPAALTQDEARWFDARLQSTAFRNRADQILFSLNRFDDKLISERTREFYLITERIEGYYVPIEALVPKGDREGIYTIYKERVRWEKVEVLGKMNGQAVISGIKPNNKVILHPKYVQEGDPFRP